MKKFLCAAVCTVAFVGIALAAEPFQAVITKVDGDKVTFYKIVDKKKSDEATTLPVATKVKVSWGTFKKGEVTVGDVIENWNNKEKNKESPFGDIGEKGVRAQITTDDDGKNITAITAFKGKKKD